MSEVSYATYWWGLLGAFGLVVWPLVVLLPLRTWRHAAVGSAGRWFLRLAGISLQVEGLRVLPAGGIIVIANHASYLDGLVLSAVIPGSLTFLAKHDFQSRPLIGTFLKRLGTIFVHRLDPQAGVEDTAAVLEAVRREARLVALPEGTFARMPGLLPFRLGAFVAAAQCGCPVVPVAVKGTRMVLRDIQWFPRRGKIIVAIGDPLSPDGKDFDAAVRLRDRCRDAILQRLGEPDLAHERLAVPTD